ncbi:MAG TPA: hypothetical protein VFW45_06655 [Candidatus Polarisedimenticolia bacterium]|nr:hypothetical protein [Candidatus Polarisedimenticolia bacterium]
MRNNQDPEQDLRARFEALRLRDAAGAGRFEAAWDAARRRLENRRFPFSFRKRMYLAATGVTAMAAAAVLIFVYRPPRPSVEEAILQAQELQSWSAPTDSLLEAAELANRKTIPDPESTKSSGGSPEAPSPRSP